MIHRGLLRLVGPFRGLLALGVATRALVYLLALAQAFAMAGALAAIAQQRPAALWLAAAVAAVLLRAVAIWGRDVTAAWIGGRVRAHLRGLVIDRILAAGPVALRGRRTGDLVTTAVDGVEGVDAYFSAYLPQLVLTLLYPPVLVAMLWSTSPTAGLIVGVGIALAVGVPRLGDRRLTQSGQARWEAFEALGADFLESIQGMSTLRVFGAIERRRRHFDERTATLLETTVRQLRLSLLELGVFAFVVQAGSVAAVLLAVRGAVTGELVGSQIFLVLLLTAECFRAPRDLGAAWHAGYLGLCAEPGLTSVLGMTSAVGPPGPDPRPAARPARVELAGVGFRYGETVVLDGLDLDVPAGAILAVVGPSGAGKTTLGDLIARHLDPAEGQVRIDGRPVSSYTAEALARSVGVVRQDSYLFPGSIAANIALGADEPDLERVRSAARAADADRFVARLEGGYAHEVGERGEGLSGGQRQRLSLARALYREPAVLILDEPTAHLDGAAETAVLEGLARLRGRCTTILITHRPTTAAMADLVAVLDSGRVVQAGEPALLATQPGPFREILRSAEVLA